MASQFSVRWAVGLTRWISVSCDISLLKRLTVSESKYFDFRADMFNVFNQTNFKDPSQTTWGDEGFGVINDAFDPSWLRVLGTLNEAQARVFVGLCSLRSGFTFTPALSMAPGNRTYRMHAEMCVNWDYGKLREATNKHAIEQMRHLGP